MGAPFASTHVVINTTNANTSFAEAVPSERATMHQSSFGPSSRSDFLQQILADGKPETFEHLANAVLERIHAGGKNEVFGNLPSCNANATAAGGFDAELPPDIARFLGEDVAIAPACDDNANGAKGTSVEAASEDREADAQDPVAVAHTS